MRMKRRKQSVLPFAGMALATLWPEVTHAQMVNSVKSTFPVEMSMTAFLIVGALLICSIILFFLFQQRFNAANRQLKDMITELGTTREHLTETNQTLEKSQQDLKQTTTRYQNILFDAQIGMFQMNLEGTCTYINSSLQELSGLYPKKALKEGFQSAIHPDDRKRFDQAWKSFIEEDTPLSLNFRFRNSKDDETHVACRANKVLNKRKEVESYIGWISDVTPFHEEQRLEKAETLRLARFVDETVEGYYHLAADPPIPLNASADKMAATIMEKMKLIECSETFAALYGTSVESLIGKGINELSGGCGPFKNNDAIKTLITSNYKLAAVESVRQDPRGNRLNLINHVIGLVEGKTLVGIRGAQRNVSQERREQEELSSQAQFMHRILDALPADVHVKDTRCRYLYASRKLADRTGIPQQDWIGKTIFEVMPATSRDHDKNAISVMKSGKLSRIERPYETRNKSGWMETLQIPLVSDDGLVEGTVGLSFEISDRKSKEELVQRERQQLEQHLKHRTDELEKSKSEYAKVTITLRNTNQTLHVREAELDNRQHEFQEQLRERKQTEELLRRNEATLLTHQKQLETRLAARLEDLEKETDKRKKWEELIEIKENELQKIEIFSASRDKQLQEEIALHKQAEAFLEISQVELNTYQQDLKSTKQEHKQVSTQLTEIHKKKIGIEHSARLTAENQLKKVAARLKTAQERIQTLTEQHAIELEHEVGEREIAATKLIQNTDELDELKQQFNERIEQETKTFKRELAKKQIREKALRQQEKDLDGRIKELEKALKTKAQENNQQIQAREEAEVKKKHSEQKFEQLSTRQSQLVEHETQKLNLNIAEIRLSEIRLRKQANDLQQEKEALQVQAKTQSTELTQAIKEQEKLAAALSEANKHLDQEKTEQAQLISKATKSLQSEVKALKQTERDLLQQEELLGKQGTELEKTIQTLSANLKTEISHRASAEKS